MSCCRDNRSWHAFRPFHGTWRCKDCCITPDYNCGDRCPATTMLGGAHRWVGHDARGLMCFPPTAIDVASEHVCHCGAGRILQPATAREPMNRSEPYKETEPKLLSEPL